MRGRRLRWPGVDRRRAEGAPRPQVTRGRPERDGVDRAFSSLVHLSNPATREERDVLIYMNQPMRYEGKAFYQASFGKGDTLSILQVVDNPGWLLPYISCVLVTVGLIIHFTVSLVRSSRKREAARLARSAQEA